MSQPRRLALAGLVIAGLLSPAQAAFGGGGHFSTVNCFVQCLTNDPPPAGGNYWMGGMTIAECCSYVSANGNCFGTGYNAGSGDAMACEGDLAAGPSTTPAFLASLATSGVASVAPAR